MTSIQSGTVADRSLHFPSGVKVTTNELILGSIVLLFLIFFMMPLSMRMYLLGGRIPVFPPLELPSSCTGVPVPQLPLLILWSRTCSPAWLAAELSSLFPRLVEL